MVGYMKNFEMCGYKMQKAYDVRKMCECLDVLEKVLNDNIEPLWLMDCYIDIDGFVFTIMAKGAQQYGFRIVDKNFPYMDFYEKYALLQKMVETIYTKPANGGYILK